MNKCKCCKNEYDIEEVKRVYGDTFWIYTNSSAQSYTKREEKEIKNDI